MIKPFEHCYWVVENKFLAGEYPRTKEPGASQKKIDALIRAGVTLFVDLTEENEGLLPYRWSSRAQRSFASAISHTRCINPAFERVNDCDLGCH